MRQKTFTKAFEEWTGKKWNWKKDDGTINSPIDSSDPCITAFYLGFNHALRDQSELTDKLRVIDQIKIKVNEVEKEIKRWKKNCK